MNFPQLTKTPLVANKDALPYFPSPYQMRAPDTSMEKFHIPVNAMLVVDRSVVADHCHFVIVDINGHKTVRRLLKAPRTWVLESGCDKPVVIDLAAVKFYGVVTRIIIEP